MDDNNYKGYDITITFDSSNKDKSYKATTTIGMETIIKYGISESQARGLLESMIDFTIAMNKK